MQSERTALYQSHANDLVANGHAYRCFCSAERLDSIARHRSEAGLPPGYDRKCGDVSAEESEDRAAKGEAHIIRLKVEEYPMFNDLVYGKSGQNHQNNSKLDFIDRVYNDPVLIKSDGHPTYHLANVVDDHCMKITHVIRGTVSLLIISVAIKSQDTELTSIRNGCHRHLCTWRYIMPSNGRHQALLMSLCSSTKVGKSSASATQISTSRHSRTSKGSSHPPW